jgi:hypothetical protein
MICTHPRTIWWLCAPPRLCSAGEGSGATELGGAGGDAAAVAAAVGCRLRRGRDAAFGRGLVQQHVWLSVIVIGGIGAQPTTAGGVFVAPGARRRRQRRPHAPPPPPPPLGCRCHRSRAGLPVCVALRLSERADHGSSRNWLSRDLACATVPWPRWRQQQPWQQRQRRHLHQHHSEGGHHGGGGGGAAGDGGDGR